MELKRLLKSSYILLLAISIMGCTKTEPSVTDPETDGSNPIICKTHPNSDYCKIITENNKEIKIKDAKPIDKIVSNGKLLKWSDPLYSEGVNLKTTDSTQLGFTVDEGTTLKEGDKYYLYIFYNHDGSEYTQLPSTIKIDPTGNAVFVTQNLNKASIGDKLTKIAVFEEQKTYLVLPPIEIIA